METINDLVKKIYSSNNVQDSFWKSYLEEIRVGTKVTWHRSSGFDFSPLTFCWSLTDNNYWGWSNKKERKYNANIGKELHETDLIFSDACGRHTDYYDMLLDLYNKKQTESNDKSCTYFSFISCN